MHRCFVCLHFRGCETPVHQHSFQRHTSVSFLLCLKNELCDPNALPCIVPSLVPQRNEDYDAAHDYKLKIDQLSQQLQAHIN